MEQYLFERITNNVVLQALLQKSGGGYNVYVLNIPTGISFTRAIRITTINTITRFPAINAVNVQIDIFAERHSDTVKIANALYDMFNMETNVSGTDVNIVYSQRVDESDIDYDEDDKLYHRQATYYFKIR